MKTKIILLFLLIPHLLSAQSYYRNWTVKSNTQKEKIALVIANNYYKSGGQLVAPIPTAKKLATKLKSKDIDVMVGHDLSRIQMLQIFQEFANELKDYQFGIVFYLGHGFQIEGENYLIPVDANPQTKWEVKYSAVNVDDVLKLMNYPQKPKVIVLDACRNNPFEQHWTSAERSGNRDGFNAVPAPSNSEILFTTQKNSKVRDNNPYIQYFMEELDKGGCLDDMVRNISRRILKSGNQQVPAKYGLLLDKVCFGQMAVSGASTSSFSIKKPTTVTFSETKENSFKLTAKKLDFIPENMVFVEGGSFEMGCVTGDSNCGSDEKPAHQVTLDDFYIGKYEVTNAEFCEFLNVKGNKTEGGATWLDIESSACQIEYKNNKYIPKSGYSQYPVIEVTWYGANAYAQWKGMRLPTEAEWEYAARSRGKSEIWAGTSTENSLDKYANYYGDKDGYSKTAPVGKFQPNDLGVYDMSGNVWEWCADWYDSAYYKNSPKSNPVNQTKATYRVLRGGSWAINAVNCRSSNRYYYFPGNSLNDYGFRLAHSLK